MPCPSMKAIMSSLRMVRSSGVGDIAYSIQYCMPFGQEPASAGGNFRISRNTKYEGQVALYRSPSTTISSDHMRPSLAKRTQPDGPVLSDAATLASETEPGVVMGTVG